MKNTNITLLFFIASVAMANAITTVTVSNLSSADVNDRAIVDNSGNIIPIGAGSIHVGYFSNLNDASDFENITRNTLLNDFKSFNDSAASFQNTLIPGGVRGFFSASFEANIHSGEGKLGNKIIGKTMFTVIGNKLSLDASSDFLIFKHDGEIFSEERGSANGNAGLVRPDDGTLVLGSNNGIVSVLGTNVGSYKMSLIPIPEPSSTALLGLGTLALMFRRRR